MLDDAPILAKGEEEWAAVLDPKVAGTLNLHDALLDDPIDFFVCYSSRSAETGLPGQVDYAAANAFLDQFATAFDRPGRRVLSIGWDAWSEVGMAARLFGVATADEDVGRASLEWTELDHPIFRRSAKQGDDLHLEALFHKGSHWMLDEHRVRDGHALIRDPATWRSFGPPRSWRWTRRPWICPISCSWRLSWCRTTNVGSWSCP